MRPKSFDKLSSSLTTIPNPSGYDITFNGSQATVNFKSTKLLGVPSLETKFELKPGKVEYKANIEAKTKTFKFSPNVSAFDAKLNVYPFQNKFDISFEKKLKGLLEAVFKYDSSESLFTSTLTPKCKFNGIELSSIIECVCSPTTLMPQLWVRGFFDTKHLSFRTSIKPHEKEVRFGVFSSFKPFSVGCVLVTKEYVPVEYKLFAKGKIAKTRLALTHNFKPHNLENRVQLRTEKRFEVGKVKYNILAFSELVGTKCCFASPYVAVGFETKGKKLETRTNVTSDGIIYLEAKKKFKKATYTVGWHNNQEHGFKLSTIKNGHLSFGAKFD